MWACWDFDGATFGRFGTFYRRVRGGLAMVGRLAIPARWPSPASLRVWSAAGRRSVLATTLLAAVREPRHGRRSRLAETEGAGATPCAAPGCASRCFAQSARPFHAYSPIRGVGRLSAAANRSFRVSATSNRAQRPQAVMQQFQRGPLGRSSARAAADRAKLRPSALRRDLPASALQPASGLRSAADPADQGLSDCGEFSGSEVHVSVRQDRRPIPCAAVRGRRQASSARWLR